MDPRKCTSSVGVPSLKMATLKFSSKVPQKTQLEIVERVNRQEADHEVDVDRREIYFLLLHFLSLGPCKRTFAHFLDELLEHQLLPRRYHSWYSRSGIHDKDDGDDGISFPLTYAELVERYSHIEKDHLVRLLKQLMMTASSPLHGKVGRTAPNAADVPTLLGTGSFSLLDCNKDMGNSRGKPPPAYLHWPHMQAGQVRALGLREIGGGFTKHHRATSTRSACYAIAKPSTLLQKMQNIKKLRGHRNAVYCAIFDRSGRYVITGSDDRLVKIWSMETALCLASCRGHEGDITDLAVSSNNAVVASAANDFVIRVWRLPDGMPVSVLQGHTGAVTAIAFSPRPNNVYQLLSSSDDGTCRIWEARFSHIKPRIYKPKPSEAFAGKNNISSNNGSSSINGAQCHQILCCAYNADGTVFVTGSSDTFARVWSALKSNTDDPEQPMHEIDVLSGHEDDVNYVQFSGCPLASKSSLSDSLKEESVPKFRNSWFCHDNIVTCSRDGSAIIWVPRSRRSHGKAGRWMRAYHLKVPPPPLPPQPARGGPRQRFLPTPRGVNMIVWSLDNRFVLAAIMDCRICVWNAVDGSLVHSLTGHSASSYVLDVHPFNPRIAMSAGYDGRTIVWDIWEGTPIRIYQMGEFKLVDGKFSADGTSIVLSDDVGQIYLINTGQGELQKDAKYDQFFLGDYRPVIRDTSGSVLDQETQLLPYQRNIQDPLCDSSMMPYPEPYQTAFQQRRLGALGIEWRASTMKLAIGPEISLGLDYQMPPLPDLERIIEPLPDFVIDAMFMEPENEVLSEDSDSEYNVAEENSSENEKESIISSSSSDSECSAENGGLGNGHKDGLRRSRRKKHKIDVMTSSGRRVKKRNLDESAGTSSGSHRNKKPKTGRKVSKRKPSKAKTLRPKRLAARNARNMLSKISGTSSDGEDESGSEHDSSDSEVVLLRDSESNSSDSESVQLKDTKMQSNDPDRKVQSIRQNRAREEDPSSNELEELAKSSQYSESQLKENKQKLVLKFSLRDLKKDVPQEDAIPKCDSQPDSVHLSSTPPKLTQEKRILKFSIGHPSTSAEGTDVELSKDHKNECADVEQPESADVQLEGFSGEKEHETSWGEVKLRTSRLSRPGDALSVVSPCVDGEQNGTMTLEDINAIRNKELDSLDVLKSSTKESSSLGENKLKCGDAGASFYEDPDKPCEGPSALDKRIDCTQETNACAHLKHSDEKENAPRNSTKIRFKTKMRVPIDLSSASKLKFVASAKEVSPGDDLTTENPPQMEDDSIYDLAGASGSFPVRVTDAARRTRSGHMKETSHETNMVNHSFKLRVNHQAAGTSRGAGESSRSGKLHDQLDRKSRSSRNHRGTHITSDRSSSSQRMLSLPVGKLSWLMLSEYEEGYRYIPQLGDEVVYLRQGHQEFSEMSRSRECPPRSLKGNLNAVEICKVEALDYTWGVGSGESCCRIKLEFIDPSSNVLGKSFALTLPELKDFSDFIVEKPLYDASIKRNWTTRDKCQVWWRNQNGEGGEWWLGRIVLSQAKSPEFPNSPWLRYHVRYKEDSSQTEQHNPWELYDDHILWERPHIDSESRDKLLHYFSKLEDKDFHIIQQLNQAVHKSDFCNRFAAQLYPELIKLRLRNNYYRSSEAVKNDIRVMLSNAESYFVRKDLAAKISSISDWLTKKLSRL